jgi:phage protein|nr:MAG TPA: virion morphogenesis protein [Caudoviricetes sp.]
MASIVEELGDLEKLQKELEYLQTHAVRVGILWSGGSLKSNTDVMDYAIFNEYGTSHIPKRPFFRLSVGTQKAQNEIKEYLNTQIENVVSGELTGQGAYENLGIFVVQKIKKTIMSGNFAPLDPKTIKRKGQSAPLIDTHSLYHSIDYEIVGV